MYMLFLNPLIYELYNLDSEFLIIFSSIFLH